jgi:hypothetical protein
MAVEPIFVDCMLAGKIIGTYEFGWPVGVAHGALPPRKALIEEAKAFLAIQGLAFPPYDKFDFVVRYPVGTDASIALDTGKDGQGEPGGDSFGNDAGAGGFGQAFGTGFSGTDSGIGTYDTGTYGTGTYGTGTYGGSALGTGALGTMVLGGTGANDPTQRIVAAAGLIAGEASVKGAAVVIPAIWSEHGDRVFAQIAQVEKNLVAFRAFAASFEEAKSALGRGHNKPPELLGVPEIDVEALDAAIAALQSLRAQVVEPEPNPQSLELIWRSLALGARVCGGFAGWVAETGTKKAAQYLDNIFDSATRAIGSSIGTPHGFAAWYVVGCTVAGDHHKEMVVLIDVVKAVGAALAH